MRSLMTCDMDLTSVDWDSSHFFCLSGILTTSRSRGTVASASWRLKGSTVLPNRQRSAMFTTNSFFPMDPFQDQKTVRVLKDAIGKKGRYLKGILTAADGSHAECWVDVEKTSKPEYKAGYILEILYVSLLKNSDIPYNVTILENANSPSVTSPRSWNQNIRQKHQAYLKLYAKARSIRFDGHYVNDAMDSMMDEIVECDTFDLNSIPDQ